MFFQSTLGRRRFWWIITRSSGVRVGLLVCLDLSFFRTNVPSHLVRERVPAGGLGVPWFGVFPFKYSNLPRCYSKERRFAWGFCPKNEQNVPWRSLFDPWDAPNLNLLVWNWHFVKSEQMDIVPCHSLVGFLHLRSTKSLLGLLHYLWRLFSVIQREAIMLYEAF